MTIVLATSAIVGTLVAKYFFGNTQSKEEPRKLGIKDKESPSTA